MQFELISQITAAKTDALAASAERAKVAADRAGLRMIPARLDLDSIVAIDELSLDVEQLVTVAAEAGARLLYLKRTTIDGEDLAKWIDEIARPDDVAVHRHPLQKALPRIHGWTEELEIGFAHAGVVHCWTMRAPWADEADDLRKSAHRRQAQLHHDDDSTGWTQPERLSDERINDLASELATFKEFRWATRNSDKEAATRNVPALAEMYVQREGRWDVHRVIRTAADLLEREREECCARLEAQKTELATALATDDGFRSIGTTEARRKYALEWIRMHHSNGLAMPRALTHELVHLAKSSANQPMF